MTSAAMMAWITTRINGGFALMETVFPLLREQTSKWPMRNLTHSDTEAREDGCYEVKPPPPSAGKKHIGSIGINGTDGFGGIKNVPNLLYLEMTTLKISLALPWTEHSGERFQNPAPQPVENLSCNI